MGVLLGSGLLLIGLMLIAGVFLIGNTAISSDDAKEAFKSGLPEVLLSLDEPQLELEKHFQQGNYESLDKVVDMLDTYPPERKKAIIRFFAEKDLVERYKKGLTDIDYKVRAISAERLGKLGCSGASELLFKAMADKNEDVRLSATGALKKINDPSIAGLLVNALKEPYKWLPARVAEVLTAIGPAAVPALKNALNDNDPGFRCYVIEVLGEIGDRSSAHVLQDSLKDINPTIRVQAARALGRVGDPSSVNALLALVSDPEVKVRVQAIRSLGLIGAETAVGGLAPMLAQGDPALRYVLLEALRKMGSTGLRAIEAAGVVAEPQNAAKNLSEDSHFGSKVTINYE